MTINLNHTLNTALLVCLTAMAAGQPPNVVVILADDQRAQDLGVAGHPVVQPPTPHYHR